MIVPIRSRYWERLSSDVCVCICESVEIFTLSLPSFSFLYKIFVNFLPVMSIFTPVMSIFLPVITKRIEFKSTFT